MFDEYYRGKSMKILVIGVSSYDTLIYVDNLPTQKEDAALWAKKVAYSIGGTGAGKALALSVLGAKTSLATDIGNDEVRDKILAFLKKEKIDLTILKADRSTTHTNIMHGNGKRLSFFTSSPQHVEYNPIVRELLASSDAVFLNINDYCRDYIPIIKKEKKTTIVDIHDYDLGNKYHQEFIDAADILFVSGVNIIEQEKFLNDYIKGKEIVIITNGDKGSVAIDHNREIYYQKPYIVEDIVDTNGAGDSYSAGFIFKYLKTKSIEESLKFASISGALTCSSQDLYNEKATEEYIETLMKNF
ncbi:MAG: carbohydrate kinase family protein [Candidatus Izemoplasmatales bacterium]|jgi:sugar/nucleoside kinase (ribokinase family)|nr:carbohydrate kinase family protein [Candidatus Izemoplasmatales bacterium]